MKKTNKNTTLSPEQYIRQKARTLPLGQCYMNKNWFISGIAIGVVCRCHKSGTYTFGVFQLDTFCTGLIECKVEFSRTKEDYDNIMAYLKNSFKIEPVTYQEVHNLIYGGIAYGEDAGFTPPTMYNLGKFLLEEDTEDIPLINYQFGRFGKHFLLAESEQELDEFMPHLIAHLGKENILFGIDGSDRYFKGEDFYDAETRKAMRQIASKIRQEKQLPLEAYSYVHPAYPAELNVKHEVVAEMLYNPENRLNLSDEQVDQLLALPHDELKADLQQILLYETGKTCDELPTIEDNPIHSVLVHCLMLLGELGDEDSLSTVLETLCQPKDFYDYHLGIIINETYVPTLYNLGKNQLDKFFAFLQIPGLYTYARYLIFPTVVQIVEHEPERRDEVIEWFRQVLQFYVDNLKDNHCCDGSLVGLVVTDLLKLKAEELLPELRLLYATGKVNEQCCGNLATVESMMKQPKQFAIEYHFEIHERYEALRKNYEQLIASQNNILVELVKAQAERNAEQEDAEAVVEADTVPTEVTEDTQVIEDAQVIEEVPAETPAKATAETSEEAPAKATKAAAKTATKATAKKCAAKPKGKAEKAEKTEKAEKAEKASTTTKVKKATKSAKTAKADDTAATEAEGKKAGTKKAVAKTAEGKEKKPRATKAKTEAAK